MKKIFIVIHYDYEDPDWSDVDFIGLSDDECYKFIDENFEYYYEDEWDEDEDVLFESKEMGKDWIKSELHLEIKELEEGAISDSLKELLK